MWVMKYVLRDELAGDGAPGGGGVAGVPSPAQPTSWVDSLDSELRGYAQLKGFKEPADVLQSYRNFEKLQGVPQEQLLRLPGKEDDTEGWAQVHSRLGRPEKPDGYNLQLPPDADLKFTEAARSWFHGAGLNEKQANAIVTGWGGFMQELQGRLDAEDQMRDQQAVQGLQKEWGAAFEKNAAVVDGAAAALGVTDEQLVGLRKALGPAGAMKFLHGIAEKLGEDQFIGQANRFSNVASPEMARAEIAQIMASEAGLKYLEGKADLATKERIDWLYKMAYPEAGA